MAASIQASLPRLTGKELNQLELNALERRHGPKVAEAAEILTAIIEERNAHKAKALAHQIACKVVLMILADDPAANLRAGLIFSARPSESTDYFHQESRECEFNRRDPHDFEY